MHWKKCTMRCCSCVTDLILLGKTSNYYSCTDQLLLMYRPTIAHAPTGWCHEQLLVGYRPTNDQFMGNNFTSRNIYYWSYIWPRTGRIVFWVWILITWTRINADWISIWIHEVHQKILNKQMYNIHNGSPAIHRSKFIAAQFTAHNSPHAVI
jgi:hypothetical protein